MEEIAKRPANSRPIQVTYCLVGTGDLDAIFEGFQRAMNRGESITIPVFDEVTNDPRWRTVEEYMNWPTG